MFKTRTVEYWEKKKGFILVDSTITPEQNMTEEEFDGIEFKDKHGVNHKDRIEFLKANGYEVTRENMVADLPNTITPEPDLGQELVNQLEAMKEPDQETS